MRLLIFFLFVNCYGSDVLNQEFDDSVNWRRAFRAELSKYQEELEKRLNGLPSASGYEGSDITTFYFIIAAHNELLNCTSEAIGFSQEILYAYFKKIIENRFRFFESVRSDLLKGFSMRGIELYHLKNECRFFKRLKRELSSGVRNKGSVYKLIESAIADQEKKYKELYRQKRGERCLNWECGDECGCDPESCVCNLL